MPAAQIVVDTNVLFSGLRSSAGASHRLLQLVGESKRFTINLSVPLVFEYEEVLKRHAEELGLTNAEIDDVLDYLCSVGRHREIYFLWRPVLTDSGDDLVLELAVESNSEFIVTFNTKHFAAGRRFGITALRPGEFLRRLGELR